MLCRNEVKNLAAPESGGFHAAIEPETHDDHCLVTLVENLLGRPSFEHWITDLGHDPTQICESARGWCRCKHELKAQSGSAPLPSLSDEAARLFAALHSTPHTPTHKPLSRLDLRT